MANVYRSSSVIVNQGFVVRDQGVTENFGGYLPFGHLALNPPDLGSLTRLEVIDSIDFVQDKMEGKSDYRF